MDAHAIDAKVPSHALMTVGMNQLADLVRLLSAFRTALPHSVSQQGARCCGCIPKLELGSERDAGIRLHRNPYFVLNLSWTGLLGILGSLQYWSYISVAPAINFWLELVKQHGKESSFAY